MHLLVISIISALAIGLSLVGWIPDPSWMIVGLAVAIAIVGVPHGGLDHWTGKAMLFERFGPLWSLVFFPLYLAVAGVVVLGWVAVPWLTLVLFVLMSAWHFGTEDNVQHDLDAIALGGLAIWIPALFRSNEMASLLTQIVPMESSRFAISIMPSIQVLAILSLVYLVFRVLSPWDAYRLHVPVHHYVLMPLFIFTPILLSFGIYFCGWHSIRGLLRLARQQNLPVASFIVSLVPLSLGALALVAVGGWWLSSQMSLDAKIVQTLFVGLSAIAVPHLILHHPRWMRLSQYRVEGLQGVTQ